jgi:hypothetical protein
LFVLVGCEVVQLAVHGERLREKHFDEPEELRPWARGDRRTEKPSKEARTNTTGSRKAATE